MRQYAPPILRNIRHKLNGILADPRNLGVDFRKYVIETLNSAAKLPPTASADTWSELLPDRYSHSLKSQS
ncbi:MAG: hypothetical protein K2N35_14180 [Muribaculaceae bacterium]|nr:hypothetical protein [Muribaculaceae bacterium]